MIDYPDDDLLRLTTPGTREIDRLSGEAWGHAEIHELKILELEFYKRFQRGGLPLSLASIPARIAPAISSSSL